MHAKHMHKIFMVGTVATNSKRKIAPVISINFTFSILSLAFFRKAKFL